MPDSFSLQKPTCKILVVDDDAVIRETIRALLETENYIVFTACDQQTAIDQAKTQLPNIVLLEIQIPGMDCLNVCKTIKSTANNHIIDIIILSQLSDFKSIDTAYQAGAVDFISKPFNWLILKQRIQHTINNQKVNQKLKNYQRKLKSAFKIAKLGEIKIDVNSKKIKFSDRAGAILQLDKTAEYFLEDLYGKTHPDDFNNIKRAIETAINNKSLFSIEYRFITNDYSEIIILHQGEYSSEGDNAWLSSTIQDISELRHVKDELEYQKLNDPLTHLSNRKSFFDQVTTMLSETMNDSLFAVIFIGLDNFSDINNSLGIEGGDYILQTLAERLLKFQLEGHIVSRYDGDVFALLIKNIQHIAEADHRLHELKHLINSPINYQHQITYITASIGVTLFPIEAEDPSDLIRGAEAAMLFSRKQGGNQFNYRTPEMELELKQRLELIKNIRAALELKEFVPYFQPQIDSTSKQIIGMEALARWQHRSKGIIMPEFFIPIAEETGLIIAIERLIIRQAITITKKWYDQGYALRVSVNLSAHHIEDDSLMPFIIEVLHETALPAECFEVEITERIAVINTEACINKLNQLRSLGIKTSMDDFGTGYSSLSQLQNLPLDTLKVDQSFVKSIKNFNDDGDTGYSDNGAIAATVIALSHNLNLNVIAEGVETNDQELFLISKGCDILQGYLFGKPMSEKDFEQYLSQSSQVKHA